jgi:hypothetical protein
MSLHGKTREDEIRAKAYEIYEGCDRVEGTDIDNWMEAEQIVFVQHVEKLGRDDEDEAFSGMLFEGSDCERR